MTLEKNADGTVLTVIPDEQMDTIAARELEGELRMAVDGVKELIFDLHRVEYMTSAALRVLHSAQKVMKNQGSMVVRHVNPEVMEIFDVTGFVDLLTIES